MNIFGLFEKRVADALGRLAASGQIPHGLDAGRVVVEPPRDPSHGSLATNAALALAKEAGTNPRALAALLAEDLRGRPAGGEGRDRRPRLHQHHPEDRGLPRNPAGGDRRYGGLRPRRAGRGAARKRGVRLGQSDRADACRPWTRRGVRRCAVGPPRLRGLRGDPRVLHQRCRRTGRRAGTVGLPALPGGAGRGYRDHPGGPLPRGLPEAGGRGPRAVPRVGVSDDARGGMAAAGARPPPSTP